MSNKELLLKIEELENSLLNVRGTECEVYSRIVGYFRPVKQWNNGKQEEYADREEYMFSHSAVEEKVQ